MKRGVCGVYFFGALLFSILLAGCVTTGDLDSLKNDITSLKVDSVNQKKEIAQLKERDFPQVKEKLSGLSEQSGSLSALRESQALLLTQLSDVSKELQTLKGHYDENKYFMDKTLKELTADRELQQARITALENELKEMKSKGAAPRKADEAASEGSKESAGASEKKVTGGDQKDPLKLYDDAHVDFKEKHYAEARNKFERFTKDFPGNVLVPNAYYWIGESFYAEKRYEDAILSYETVVKKYPEHDKARAAMLKQAYAFVDLGDKKTGKVILERVIEKYPKSPEAELAQKKLKEIVSSGSGQGKGKTKAKKN